MVEVEWWQKLYFILSFKNRNILGGPRFWLSAVYQSEEKTRLLFHSWNISLTHDFCSILLPIISDTSYILAIKQTFHRTKQEEIYSSDLNLLLLSPKFQEDVLISLAPVAHGASSWLSLSAKKGDLIFILCQNYCVNRRSVTHTS